MMTKGEPLPAAAEAVAGYLAQAGDARRAEQISELADKLAEGRLAVAFCGHFSAGKSTLVNRLCGAPLLPSGPVPTSANVVTIRGGGEPRASIVRLVNGRPETIEAPPEQLEKYCVDGEQFVAVDIVYPSPLLGDHTVLLDTPGIDSTDDAHRLATESALHLADVVFYVMDYNHVQSEINFAFARQLKDWGKPLYLIVNQIDKHRERELPFAAYRAAVEEAFANWHLEPDGIVYLSLRDPEHPHSEWSKLTALLARLREMRAELAAYSVGASLRHIAETHLKERENGEAPERDRLLAEAGGEEAAARLRSEAEELERKLEELKQRPERLRQKVRADVQAVLDNANVTPAATRDLAHAFLESRKPGFRAGLLFAGAKTAAEKERRLEAFRADLASQVEAAVVWHVKDALRKAAESFGPAEAGDGELDGMLARLDWTPDDEFLLKRVKEGAVFGNEYTMTYCRDVAADTKSWFRQRAFELADELAERAAQGAAAEAAAAEAALAELRGRSAALEALSGLERAAAERRQRLLALLPEPAARPALPAPDALSAAGAAQGAATAADTPPRAAAPIPAASPIPAAQPQPAPREAAGAASAAGALAGGEALAPLREAAARLGRAAELLAPFPALGTQAAAMRARAERLAHSRFTIALFGAFSAGKSSLANALIGEPVLPVSPNPTTAAINRIVPPAESFPHGTARVVMKTREAMLSDLRYSLALLGEEVDGVDEAGLLRRIASLSPEAVRAGARPHYSFLKAAHQGWEENAPLLGRELAADREQYRRFVAEESRSCFVREIELHYRCPMTDQGIVLVDTPGADSVNARHTDVAFNYIKNADAVLFVTYYNHAFSQADRQFLTQLGRVKDQFELDKMFFLVNAADLAASAEELQGVLAHVERNLLEHGIRFPRLFPVSSLEALDAKLAGDRERLARSGLAAFEDAFIGFTRGELGQVALSAAEQELERTRSTIADWLAAAEGDAATREAERRRWRSLASFAARRAAELAVEPVPSRLADELRELLFYVLQRIRFRFGDFYNLAFNPSALQDDGRDMRKTLWLAWLELQRLLQTELSQELLATSLRMEKTVTALCGEAYGRAAGELAAELSGYAPAPYAPEELPTPEPPADWTTDAVEAKWLWSRFKSPRHFFEGDGKAALRQELEKLLAEPLQSWASAREAEWKELYAGHWERLCAAASARLEEDAAAFVEGKIASLEDGADPQSLRKLRDDLAKL